MAAVVGATTSDAAWHFPQGFGHGLRSESWATTAHGTVVGATTRVAARRLPGVRPSGT
jgi:hypothetical protein